MTPDFNDLPHAVRLMRAGTWDGRVPYAVVVLTYDDRFLRRRRLVTVHDEGFFVNLAEVTSLDHRDAFELADGRLIEVIAAEEPVMEVTGPNLAALAWHIGNRHTPCQVEGGRLVIRKDHVLEDMLRGLGAQVTHRMEPFTPLGGAYGHGRTMGHDHGPAHAQGPGGHFHDEPPSGRIILPRALAQGLVIHDRPDAGPFEE
jgi:urease accessory protein